MLRAIAAGGIAPTQGTAPIFFSERCADFNVQPWYWAYHPQQNKEIPDARDHPH
jgi:hypothetical protein